VFHALPKSHSPLARAINIPIGFIDAATSEAMTVFRGRVGMSAANNRISMPTQLLRRYDSLRRRATAEVDHADVEKQSNAERARDHVREAEVEADLRFSVSARVPVDRERDDDAQRGNGVDGKNDRSPASVARGALGAQRDMAEQRAEEPQNGAEERENAKALRGLAKEIGRERSRRCLRVGDRRGRRAARWLDQPRSGHGHQILSENQRRA
jgi:hypothetical protein